MTGAHLVGIALVISAVAWICSPGFRARVRLAGGTLFLFAALLVLVSDRT